MAPKKSEKDPEITTRNRRIALISAVVLGAAGVFVSAGIGLKAIDQRAAELITDSDPAVQIMWGTDASGHIWMPIAERDRVHRLVKSSVMGTRALSWHPLHHASKALESTGWVDGYPEARWSADGTITIEARWRIPAAVVRRNGRDTLIDYNAHVLPLDYAHDLSNQYVIHNTAIPNPGTGNKWDEPEIRDALRLIVELQDNKLHPQVLGIDLGTGRDHGILQILTDNNARIVFGGGPGRSRPAEMPSSVKLERLNSLLSKTGRIDAGAMILDVRGPDITMQRHEN